MPNHERSMLAYVRLAALSQRKQQLGGRDKFLILAGVEACRAGWPEVADRCRELILEHNPAHLLHRYPSIPQALQDEDFHTFLKQLERFCGLEKAEHLLTELGIDVDVSDERRDAGAGSFSLDLLSDEH